MIHSMISVLLLSYSLISTTNGIRNLAQVVETCDGETDAGIGCAAKGEAFATPECCQDPVGGTGAGEACEDCTWAPTTATPTTATPTTTPPTTATPTTATPTVVTTTTGATTTTCVCTTNPCDSSGSGSISISDSSSGSVSGCGDSASGSSSISDSSDDTDFASTLVYSDSSDSSSGSSSSSYVNTDGCICTTTLTPVSDGSSSDSSDSDSVSGDSSGDTFSAYAAGLHEDGGIGALLGEDEANVDVDDEVHYTMSVSLSDFTLMNIWGLFGLLMIANVICCCVCNKKKETMNKVRVDDEEMGGSRNVLA